MIRTSKIMKLKIRSQKSEIKGRNLESGVRRPTFDQRAMVCRPASGIWRLASGVRPLASSSGRSLTSNLWPLTSGFSLIEVSLAMMVMAIGILSILALFPAGLDQGARSLADTHAALFAEEVFAGLQAYAETNWVGLESSRLPIAASPMWSNMATNSIYVTGVNTNNIVVTNIYINNNYEDYALRYRLVVVTNVGVNNFLKAATLWIWPGEFGTTNDAVIFYTEFYKFQ